MLVKLAFVMQRLKKYLKKICHDQQGWGGERQFLDFMEGHNCYKGGRRAHWGPPTRENPVQTDTYIYYSVGILSSINSRRVF